MRTSRSSSRIVPGGAGVVLRRDVAPVVDARAQVPRHAVFPGVVGIAEHFESRAIVMHEDRTQEQRDRMLDEIARQVAHAYPGARVPAIRAMAGLERCRTWRKRCAETQVLGQDVLRAQVVAVVEREEHRAPRLLSERIDGQRLPVPMFRVPGAARVSDQVSERRVRAEEFRIRLEARPEHRLGGIEFIAGQKQNPQVVRGGRAVRRGGQQAAQLLLGLHADAAALRARWPARSRLRPSPDRAPMPP